LGVPIDAAGEQRARWLAEVAEALDAAHHLLMEVEVSPAVRSHARELYYRIEAARLEVQSLRLSRSLHGRTEQYPERIRSAPWTGFEQSCR
jgi:hypothetical protein